MARTREFDTDSALAAIADKFWADGYEATGIADLVEVTGVGRASLYAAFGSKRGMLHRAIDRYLDTEIEELWGRVDGGGLDGAQLMFRNFAAVRAKNPERARMGCLMVNSSVELGRSDSAVVELGERYRARIHAAFRSAYEAAVASGEMADGHVEERADLSSLLLLGCFVAIKAGAELAEVERLTARAIDLIESWRL